MWYWFDMVRPIFKILKHTFNLLICNLDPVKSVCAFKKSPLDIPHIKTFSMALHIIICVNFVDHLKINHYWNEQIRRANRARSLGEGGWVWVWHTVFFAGRQTRPRPRWQGKQSQVLPVETGSWRPESRARVVCVQYMGSQVVWQMRLLGQQATFG